MGTMITVMQEGKPAIVDLDEYVEEAVKRAVRALVPKGTKVVSSAALEGTPLGLNTSYHWDGKKLVIVADLSEDAISNARRSKKGKFWTLASSNGMIELKGAPIPGLVLALNLNSVNPPSDGAGVPAGVEQLDTVSHPS